jgi:hypothetical protein
MTDDVIHGLALLADEAEPAPIDSRDVIARARARTRNRCATFATVLATVAVIGSLAVTLGLSRSSTDVATDPRSTEDRLNTQMRTAAPHVIPSWWSWTAKNALVFHCWGALDGVQAWDIDEQGTPIIHSIPQMCRTSGSYSDASGQIELGIDVILPPGSAVGCAAPDCESQRLPDGTMAWVIVAPEPAGRQVNQRLSALRPDGTTISVSLLYPVGRPMPPLTTDEMMKFATVFDI